MTGVPRGHRSSVSGCLVPRIAPRGPDRRPDERPSEPQRLARRGCRPVARASGKSLLRLRPRLVAQPRGAGALRAFPTESQAISSVCKSTSRVHTEGVTRGLWSPGTMVTNHPGAAQEPLPARKATAAHECRKAAGALSTRAPGGRGLLPAMWRATNWTGLRRRLCAGTVFGRTLGVLLILGAAPALAHTRDSHCKQASPRLPRVGAGGGRGVSNGVHGTRCMASAHSLPLGVSGDASGEPESLSPCRGPLCVCLRCNRRLAIAVFVGAAPRQGRARSPLSFNEWL